MTTQAMHVSLRAVDDGDIDELFAHLCDPVAHRLAAFTATPPGDRAAFDAYWSRRRADAAAFVRTVDVDGTVAGHVLCEERWGQWQVAYWIARERWGCGVATEALRQFVAIIPMRPLHARAVRDNIGSLRVLEKCGFVAVGEDRTVSMIRVEEVDAVMFVLER